MDAADRILLNVVMVSLLGLIFTLGYVAYEHNERIDALEAAHPGITSEDKP